MGCTFCLKSVNKIVPDIFHARTQDHYHCTIEDDLNGQPNNYRQPTYKARMSDTALDYITRSMTVFTVPHSLRDFFSANGPAMESASSIGLLECLGSLSLSI